jgi:hypothetical protein
MPMLRRVLALAAIAAMTLLVTACERKVTLDKITNVQVSEAPASCFACHSDSPTDTLHLVAAQQQWEHSKHASGETLNENDGQCKNCHTSEGYVARAGTCTSFATADQSSVIDNPTSINCFTCHAPHTNGDFRLRWACSTTLMDGTVFDLHEGNLCASCHQSRRNVNTYITASIKLTNRFGPHHGPQGDLLLGSNGYEYAGYVYEQTNHKGATTNGGLNGCIECHMKTTSQNVVGGHSWNMSFDLNGSEVLNTDACTACHGAISDFSDITLNGNSVQDSVAALTETLRQKLVTAGLLNDTTAATNPDLPKSVTTSADSAGAVWNYLIVEADRSEGVHNAKYILGLLDSSIKFIDGAGPAPRPAPTARVVAMRRH